MRDRHPDDLFDALRDRLADYGQEPPAPLWAGIRAQLPPPVAAPQLRPRRRSVVLLLGLLLLVVGAAGWQWWRTGGVGRRAGRDAAGTATGNPASAAAEAREARRPAASRARTAPPLLATRRAAAIPGAAPVSAAPGLAVAQTPSAYSPNKKAAFAHPLPIASATRAERAAALPSASSHERRLVALRAGQHAASASLPTGYQTRKPLPNRPVFDGAGQPGAAGAEALVAGATQATIYDSRPAVSLRAPAPAPTAVAATPTAETVIGLPAEASSALAAGLVARVVAPRPLAGAAPAAPVVRAWADTVPPRSRPVVRRWAVLVLAGPALTHRQLGAAGASAGASPSPGGLYPTTADFSLIDELAQQERPSAGFGAQVLLRRALSGRWSLSTGLGYQQYASQASTSAPNANRFLPTPAPESAHRDTYRFLTVPVRLGYALGPANGRLRSGLLAGADAALYLGGSTLAPDGSLSTWDRSNSPYRALSVALSAGLEVRYRLAPRLNLVAQPTATYFLTSLPKPTAGRDSRYLWGVGGLLGISFDLF